MKDDIQFWASVASPIIAVIGIFVALYISRKSTEDILKLTVSNKTDSDNQIKTLRTVSINEIRQLRILTQTLLIAVIHSLEKENAEIDIAKQKLLGSLKELLRRYEKIKGWKIEDSNLFDIDEINTHFSELYEIEDSLVSLIENFRKLVNYANSTSVAFEKLNNPIQEFCESELK